MSKASAPGKTGTRTRPKAEAEATPDAVEFVASWHEVMRAIQRARGRASQAPSNGLSVAQYQIMAPLASGELLMSEVAVAAGVAGPTATRAVSNLVELGFLVRKASKCDGRQVMVSLTPLGRRTLTRKRQEMDANNRVIADGLSPQQQRDGAIILRRLSELLDEYSPWPPSVT